MTMYVKKWDLFIAHALKAIYVTAASRKALEETGEENLVTNM